MLNSSKLDLVSDELNTNITNILHKTANKVTGKVFESREKRMVPWWSDDCTEAIKK